MNLTMEVTDNGLVIKGAIPIDQMTKIAKMGAALGFDLVDAGAAQALGATMVITNKSGSQRLRDEIEKRNSGKSAEDAWLFGADTGMSSKTIFGIMTGKSVGEGSFPWDPDDFGRCYRLLARFPAWRARLPEVVKKYPRWSGLVENWDQLTRLYEEELPKKSAPKLYARMQELIKQ